VDRTIPVVGRNEPCPCGSGRKYKQCCLDKDETKARQTRAKTAEKEAKAAEKAARAAEKAGKGAEKAGKGADKKGASGPASDKTAPPRPTKPQTHQPWKKAATNTHAFQRMTTPRKVGGGG
jgi:hypothetical protein